MLSTIHASGNSCREHQHELSPAPIYVASIGMNCRRRQFMPGDNSCRNTRVNIRKALCALQNLHTYMTEISLHVTWNTNKQNLHVDPLSFVPVLVADRISPSTKFRQSKRFDGRSWYFCAIIFKERRYPIWNISDTWNARNIAIYSMSKRVHWRDLVLGEIRSATSMGENNRNSIPNTTTVSLKYNENNDILVLIHL